MKHCTLDDPFDSDFINIFKDIDADFDVGSSGSKVVFMGKKLKPEVFWQLGQENGKLVSGFNYSGQCYDFRGALSIGLAELPAMFGGIKAVGNLFDSLIRGFESTEMSWAELYNTLSDFGSKSNPIQDSVFSLMRTVELDSCHTMVSAAANLLYLLSYVTPEVFCKAMGHIMRAYGCYLYKALIGTEKRIEQPRLKSIRFDVIDSDTESRYNFNVSDGRGIALVYTLAQFKGMLQLMFSKDSDNLTNNFGTDINPFLSPCLSTDCVGLYHNPASEHFGDHRIIQKLYTNIFYLRTDPKFDNRQDRKLYSCYEGCGLAKYIADYSNLKECQKAPVFTLDFATDSFPFFDKATYATSLTSAHAFGILASCISDTRLTEHKEMSRGTDEKELVHLRGEIRRLTAENSKLSDMLQESEKQYMAELKDKDYKLDLRLDQLQRLQLKLNTIENEIQGYYDDKTFDELPEDVQAMNQEDMINFLNQFRIAIIGGFNTKVSQLRQRGMTNIVAIEESGDIRNTPTSADFIVVCTRFISHKLTLHVRSLFKDPDMFLYFNGTNADKLIAVCYDFVMNRLGGYDE